MISARRRSAANEAKAFTSGVWPGNTAWRRVCEVMEAAKIVGPHAKPKGLRHGIGIKAITSGVPLNMLEKRLGHAQLSTTSIYADAHGAEAHQLAKRMWT